MPNLRALASISIGVALVLAPAAAASGSTPSVTFTGTPLLNLGTLCCPSTPDTSHVTLAGGSVITFINHTGRDATLHVGTQEGTVPDQASVHVTLQDGTYTAEMDPDCALDDASHGQVTIDVKPATLSATPASAAATHQTTTGHTKLIAAAAPAAKPTVTTGSGAKTNAAAKPTSAAGIQPQIIGKSPGYVTVNNRGVLELLAIVMALVAVCAAICAYYMRKIHLRMPTRGDSGGGDHGARDVPEGQAAQIFQLARRIGRNEGGGPHGKIMSRK